MVDTVHAMIMYHNHKAYVRDVVLNEKLDTSPQELSVKIGIPLGEALVIIYELQIEKAKEGKS